MGFDKLFAPLAGKPVIAHTSDASDLDDLFLRADKALFAAKHAGRDCICIDGHAMAVAPNLTAIN